MAQIGVGSDRPLAAGDLADAQRFEELLAEQFAWVDVEEFLFHEVQW